MSSQHTRDFTVALPIAVAVIVLFVVLQGSGIIDATLREGASHYSTAFIVGLLASVSSCMAVVGGLVLSLSANAERSGRGVKPQVGFHAARLIAFFLLGGVIGVLGTAFTLGPISTFVLSLIVGLFMLVLGIRLLDLWQWADRIRIMLPESLSQTALSRLNGQTMWGPIALGALTFFLPCGFTQSMQVYTLSTGSFFAGGMTMFVFALGTLPILALMSFSSLSVHESPYRGVYLKTAGLIVVALALLNIWNSLAAIGVVPVIF